MQGITLNRFIRQFSVYWAPLFVWMGVIFWGTSLSGGFVGRFDTGVPFAFDAAHVVEFAILAALAYRAFRTWEGFPSLPALWGAVAAFTVLYAISDEVHQSFIPGRWPSGADLALDTVGGVVGLALADVLLRGRA